jgi:hypothetical protein
MTLTLWVMAAVIVVLLVLGLLVSVRGSRGTRPGNQAHQPGNHQDDGRYARWDLDGGSDGGNP